MNLKTRSEKEIKNAIRDQLTYIKNSCDLYDEGCTAEAIRISTALSILLDNRKSSKGILQRVEVNLTLLSTIQEARKADPNRLITKKKTSIAEAKKDIRELRASVKSDNSFLLFYIEYSEECIRPTTDSLHNLNFFGVYL